MTKKLTIGMALTALPVLFFATGPAGASPAPTDARVASSDVVLDEIAADLDTVGDDYIELRNTSSNPVNVGGWELFGCNTTSSFTIATFPSITEIPANGSLLIAGPDYSGSLPDFQLNGDLEQAGGGVEMTDASFSLVEDVRWGTPHSDCSPFADAGVSPDDDSPLARNTTPPPTWCAPPPGTIPAC